jgi:hypothetical protein
MDRDYMEQRRASVAAARAMGLREGDEVAVGGRAYAVARISDDGVEGELMTESGHFVSSSSLDELDMRLPGWVRLANSPAGDAPLRGALVRLIKVLQFNGSHLRTPYEALAGVLRIMSGTALLPREQMAEVLSLPESERAGLAVAAVIELGGLALVLGDLNAVTVPLSVFQPSGCASPDFGRLALDDYGRSICFGEYEASSRFALQAARAELARAGGEGGPQPPDLPIDELEVS